MSRGNEAILTRGSEAVMNRVATKPVSKRGEVAMLPFKHLISSNQLTPEVLSELFAATDHMKNVCERRGRSPLLASRVVALLFYEPSSRTMLSFQSAAQRLYAGVLFAQGKESSALKKRETLHDSMSVFSGYCDAIIMRHPDKGSAEKAAAACAVPFINAGDGGNEHPTQALIDAYTIHKELGRLDNLHVAFGFDPLQSRSIHSLAFLLAQYPGSEFTFVSPEPLAAGREFLNTLKKSGVTCHESNDLAALKDADVIYLNRLQEERFENSDDFERYRRLYVLQPEMIGPKQRLILDPLPRIDEIALAVDELPQAAYFRQAHNGVAVRMALLVTMLKGVGGGAREED
ncbi:aspartate carbamoyltransferase [Candidatus Eisenbacteria bacterium]|uniref:Aspartate carbamoyltransferase n=1 Tax=Eiseniibacteriota bacterium TaxID=2212470 RepID=A0ABV6YKX6_UNCEI